MAMENGLNYNLVFTFQYILHLLPFFTLLNSSWWFLQYCSLILSFSCANWFFSPFSVYQSKLPVLLLFEIESFQMIHLRWFHFLCDTIIYLVSMFSCLCLSFQREIFSLLFFNFFLSAYSLLQKLVYIFVAIRMAWYKKSQDFLVLQYTFRNETLIFLHLSLSPVFKSMLLGVILLKFN